MIPEVQVMKENLFQSKCVATFPYLPHSLNSIIQYPPLWTHPTKSDPCRATRWTLLVAKYMLLWPLLLGSLPYLRELSTPHLDGMGTSHSFSHSTPFLFLSSLAFLFSFTGSSSSTHPLNVGVL